MKKFFLLGVVLLVFAGCVNNAEDGAVTDFANDVKNTLEDEIVVHDSLPDQTEESIVETTEKSLVEDYICKKIASLVPKEPVLGGSWYVVEVEFLSENRVRVLAEDGHIQSEFTANYLYENGEISLNNISEVE